MASRSRSHRRFPRPAVRPIGNTHSRSRFRPSLLVLEDRTMLSTFQVTNTNDSGTGSLRYELSQAGNGDTITFSSLFNSAQTITLTSGALNITTSVYIQGPAPSLLTIDGNHQSGVMTIEAGANVTVSDLSLANGSASRGGAIDNLGTLTLTDCTVSGSSATVAGGIDNAGTLTLNGGTISNNTSKFGGGGLYNEAT